MAQIKTSKSDRISARIGSLKPKIEKICAATGHRDSDVIRAALDHFFSTYATKDSAMSAIRAYRMKEAAK